MPLDYSQIGKRIAKRRKQLNLTQAKAAERAEISDRYLSGIERAASIPSIEVVMRLALALDTTPDEFLVGTVRFTGEEDARRKNIAERLRTLNTEQLRLIEDFTAWVSERRPNG